ncbi:uncharacterized protein WM277_012740 [Molossus nigricans]
MPTARAGCPHRPPGGSGGAAGGRRRLGARLLSPGAALGARGARLGTWAAGAPPPGGGRARSRRRAAREEGASGGRGRSAASGSLRGPSGGGRLGGTMALRARALYDFRSENPGEISLREHEVLSLCSEQDIEGWFEGINSRGDRGLFPASYVQVTHVPQPRLLPAHQPPA